MSDPVANVDIEDVLASIRRLVSGGAEADRIHPERLKGEERLVLTPSQRVDGEDSAPSADDAPTIAEDVSSPADDQGGEATAPDEHATVTAPAGEGRAEHLHEPQQARAEEMIARLQAAEPGAAAPDAAPVSETEAPPTGPEIEDRAGHGDMTPPEVSEMWEPDGDDEDAYAEGAATPTIEWRDAEAEGPQAEEEPSRDPDDMAADEAASAAFARDWDAQSRARSDARDALDLDEAVLDEETLRDLVAEIVREELMGTLGERITRNVRKLVRREIHRALTTQDFD
ncbi:MAG: hypothetical protein CMN17_12430 [Roseovarius sp.]|nr:hypothetical protein [Roseovarius sp.]MBK44757.1 hypothetical protein [Roseovarius sp.]|tara:strand:+ start:583 stop:1437 length:855 start_codon:yes stop_codon:yes gene_type:complete